MIRSRHSTYTQRVAKRQPKNVSDLLVMRFVNQPTAAAVSFEARWQRRTKADPVTRLCVMAFSGDDHIQVELAVALYKLNTFLVW